MRRVIAQTPPQLLVQLHGRGYTEPALRAAAAALEHATRAVDGLYRGSGKPFICHLVGVASIVAHAAARPQLVLAALLHALPQARVDASPGWRARVLGFGDDVLALVEAYDSFAASAAGAALPSTEVELLLLADELEDLVDLGPCFHAEGPATLRGSAAWRLQRAQAELAARCRRARALGQPWMARAFTAWTLRSVDPGLPHAVRGVALSSGRLLEER